MTSQESALKKVNYTGEHAHSHNKGGKVGALKGLINTKNFGETKQGRKLRKKHEKMSGAELFT